MGEKLCLFLLVSILGLAIKSANAIKCTHSAYFNDNERHEIDCEGKWCSIQVTIDTRVSATMVHKSCEEINQVQSDGSPGCVNVTKGGVQSIICTCNTDFCTNSATNDVDFVTQMLVSKNLGIDITGASNNNATAAKAQESAAVVASPGIQMNGKQTTGTNAASTPKRGTTHITIAPMVSPETELLMKHAPAENDTEPEDTAGTEPVGTTEAGTAPTGAETTVVPSETPLLSEASSESITLFPPLGDTTAPAEGITGSEPTRASPVLFEGTTPGVIGGEGSTTPGLLGLEGTSVALEEGTTGSTGTEITMPGLLGLESLNDTTTAPEEGTTPNLHELQDTTPSVIGLEGTNETTGAPEESTPAIETSAPPENVTEALTSPAETGGTTLAAIGSGSPNATAAELMGAIQFTEPSTTATGGSEPTSGASETAASEPTSSATEPGATGSANATTELPPIEPLGMRPPEEGGEMNATTGLAAMETIVNERVQYFSAVSLQRLPTYLAEKVVLTPDKQHYDVLTNRLDGDMLFNQEQLDDIVEGERIYLPPKPMQESESTGPEPFSGVLIGRDLEQANAWPAMQAVSYYFKPTVDNDTRKIIREALDMWQNNTCVIFSEVTAQDQYAVEIDSQPVPPDVIACGASTVGRWPEVKLTIWQTGPDAVGCLTTGTIAHEIGHVLGLWHAQSTFDAYNFVYVMADTNGQVDVHPQSASQSNYDVGYDYGSIMHFAEDTLRPKDPRYAQTTGQRRAPSFIDYKTINLQQRCVDLCPPIDCYVGGYATPPDCTKCHCPTGFGGDHCETVQTSEGECGKRVGSIFANDEWQDLTVTFGENQQHENENKCFWHLWGKNGSQIELEIVNVSMVYSPTGCTDTKTGVRNFVEIKVGDNDADRSFDFQRTGFRSCSMAPLEDKNRPIVSTNRMIVLLAYAGSAGTFSVRFRNAGGGNPGMAAAVQASAMVSPVRPGLRVSGSENAAQTLFEPGEEGEFGRNEAESERCDIRRSLVPGDRLATPCRVMRSYYDRYMYIFTKSGHHNIFFTEKYFEPRILIYQARHTPLLKNAALVNDKDGVLHIQDAAGPSYEPFPYFLSADKQKALGPLKMVITEDGRLVTRSENGTELTLVCLGHFACVRLHRRLQSPHDTSNDTRVMLQGGILYSDNRLYFLTLSAHGELAIWERAKATDAVSTSSSKMIWTAGAAPKDRAGQPYRLYMDRKGVASVRDGDNEIIWKVDSPINADQLPTTLGLSDTGKLTLVDAHGKEIWSNGNTRKSHH